MDKKIRILLVSQYFPPYNTPRAFRTYELAKELAKEGHEVIVYSLLGNYDYHKMEIDDNFKICNLGKSKLGNADSIGNWNKNIIYRVLAHTVDCFPEIEFLYLIKKNIKNIEKYDLIISVAFPYPIHWGIGLMKKKMKNFPCWISDCGDPFMGNPFRTHSFYFKFIEKWWGKLTDFITIPIEQAKVGYYPEVHDKIRVIPQGFNYSDTPSDVYITNKIPTFIYAGAVYKDKRDPRNFLDYLTGVKDDFKFIVYTNDFSLFLKYETALNEKLELNSYIERPELIKKLSKADFIINLQNAGTVQAPSKLIDYTLAKRPILNITSEFKESEYFIEFLKGDYSHKMDSVDISQYDIRSVASRFISLYEEFNFNNSKNKL